MEVVGASGWTPDEIAAEEARCAAVWACLWECTSELAQGVARALSTCPDGEIVLLLEDSGGFHLGWSDVDHIRRRLAVDPAGYTEEVRLGIEDQLRSPCRSDQRKIVIRFRSGVVAVRAASVVVMGKGGVA